NRGETPMDAGTAGVGILGILLIFALIIAFGAPIVLGASREGSGPMIIAVVLTISAVIVFAASKTVIDQIAAIGVWLGAMIAGLASYLNTVITGAGRNLAFRLIN